MTEGNNTFVLVPTVLEVYIASNKVKIITRPYLLGISSDTGKTWKFVGGAQANKMSDDQFLPKLPAKLILPKEQDPEFIEDK